MTLSFQTKQEFIQCAFETVAKIISDQGQIALDAMCPAINTEKCLSHLAFVCSVTEIFAQEKEISLEIYARTAFGDVNLADSQILTNMLNCVTQNKLKTFENALIQPKKIQSESIAEIFVQKIAIPLKNTAVSPIESPFYNMRVTMHKI